MKIAATGDLHLTKNKPVNRIDDYWETAKRKLRFIFEVAKDEEAKVIIAPGDMTDTPSLSYFEFSELVELMWKGCENINFLTIFGQHDMRYRTKPNTALYALEKALGWPSFRILDSAQPVFFHRSPPIAFSAASYGEDIPEPIEGAFNILIIHKMIIEEKLWSAQEDYEASNTFLRRHNYDLIVSGDNHQGFIEKTPGGRLLVNCGAMMRSKIDQVDHKPFIVVYDTDTKKHKQIFIPIEPAEKVFQLDKVEIEKERNENLGSFVSGLLEQKDISSVFEDNLLEYCKENNISEEVMTEIKESFIKE